MAYVFIYARVTLNTSVDISYVTLFIGTNKNTKYIYIQTFINFIEVVNILLVTLSSTAIHFSNVNIIFKEENRHRSLGFLANSKQIKFLLISYSRS